MEVQQFPLYDRLKEQVSQNRSQSIDLRCICMTINSMHQKVKTKEEVIEHLYAIAALIHHHEMLGSGGVTFHAVPYMGRIIDGGKGPLFTMVNLPPLLQHIIAAYVLGIANPE